MTGDRVLQRVVVTGVGVVSPLGHDVSSFWAGLLAGRSAVGPITQFDAAGLPVRFAAEVRDFDPGWCLDRRVARRTGRFAQFAVAAAWQAWRQAGLPESGGDDETGVLIASEGGLFETSYQERLLQGKGPQRVDPLFIPKVGPHMASVRVARELRLRGPNSSANSACASGLDAIGQAFNWVRLGHAQRMLAGGAEAILQPVTIATLALMGALSTRNEDPAHASRPFDRERDGFVIGEGAGLLLLEAESSARARGARILCEIAGAGWSFDAVDDTAPDAAGQALAMRRALADAGMAPEEIGYVKAHGTSTPLNDKTETAAIKMVLGEHAYRTPVSSIKSMIGHAVCAAGALEAVACVQALCEGWLPPTINYEVPDPACDLDVVPNEARHVPGLAACLANAFGLGGQNTSLVLRRYEAR